jgi:hypothetical protein
MLTPSRLARFLQLLPRGIFEAGWLLLVWGGPVKMKKEVIAELCY